MAARESGRQARIVKALEARGAYVINVVGGGGGRGGVLDLILGYRTRAVTLEVKTTGGRLSPRQKYEMAKARAAGVVSEVVRTVPEAIAVLDRIDAELDQETA